MEKRYESPPFFIGRPKDLGLVSILHLPLLIYGHNTKVYHTSSEIVATTKEGRTIKMIYDSSLKEKPLVSVTGSDELVKRFDKWIMAYVPSRLKYAAEVRRRRIEIARAREQIKARKEEGLEELIEKSGGKIKISDAMKKIGKKQVKLKWGVTE